MSITASHYGLTEQQANRVVEFMNVKMKDWPQDLKDYANKRKPGCGEEIVECLADWVKDMDKPGIDLDELQREVNAVSNLLKDRHPGLFAWNEMLAKRLRNIRKLTNEALGS